MRMRVHFADGIIVRGVRSIPLRTGSAYPGMEIGSLLERMILRQIFDNRLTAVGTHPFAIVSRMPASHVLRCQPCLDFSIRTIT